MTDGDYTCQGFTRESLLERYDTLAEKSSESTATGATSVLGNLTDAVNP